MMIFALVLFLITYALLLVFPKYRAYIALGTALIFVVTRMMSVEKIFTVEWIPNWNVLMMILGTMGVVALFIESKMPALLADAIIDRMPNVMWATVALSLFAGLISAFVDNVATVLMVAPVAVTVAKKLKISPVNMIIAIAISSNLQGAATLVGDTTSILLGAEAHMNFAQFFFFQHKFGLFWICQVAAIVSAIVLLFLFRKDKQPIHMDEKTKVTDYLPTYLLLGTILLLIVASFLPIPDAVRESIPINGIICVGLFLLGLLRNIIKKVSVKSVIMELDAFTLLLLFGLFVIIGGVEEVGIIDKISQIIQSISGGNIFIIFSILVWISVALSAVIDNIPYVMTMLPVVTIIAQSMGVEPYVLYFGLVVGATLGGNLTPIGASANIAGLGILRKEGYEVKAGTFMRISVPFTLSAVLVGYIMVWLIFKPAGIPMFG
jgi:Na+/H+ antiporter NhaD/arsenite permease-like protein